MENSFYLWVFIIFVQFHHQLLESRKHTKVKWISDFISMAILIPAYRKSINPPTDTPRKICITTQNRFFEIIRPINVTANVIYLFSCFQQIFNLKTASATSLLNTGWNLLWFSRWWGWRAFNFRWEDILTY